MKLIYLGLLLAFGLVSSKPGKRPIYKGPMPKPDADGIYHIGDMVLDSEEFNILNGNGNGAKDRAGLKSEQHRWLSGQIPYEFAGDHNREERGRIENEIKDFNEKLSGCLMIRPKTKGDKDWVRIMKGDGCVSWVGRVKGFKPLDKKTQQTSQTAGAQELSLASGCIRIGNHRTTQHEFIHAFGFDHEQNRSDRDDYVRILWNNIESDAKDQYYEANKDSYKQFGTPYDGRSIMHYTSKAFVKNHRLDTMKSLGSVPTDQLGGQKLQLSDIKKLKNMYKCCQNIHSSCQYWADKGFCATGHQYEKFMKRDCGSRL